jgi:AraC-like DNA-binding protein
MNSLLFSGGLVSSDRILYTPSTFAKTNLIHLQEAGSLNALKPHTSKRENLSSYLFFIVTNGEGSLEYDGNTYSLATGDCVFIDCHKTYSHQTTDKLWSLKWVHFFGPNMSGIFEKYVERGGKPVFHPTDIQPYSALLGNIFDVAKSSDYTRDMKIYQQLVTLLNLLMDESWNPQNNAKTNYCKQNLQNVKDYLDSHYTEKITLDLLSEMFFINKFYLARVFKEQFGVPVNTYLIQVRITHAKQMLRFTDMPIEKIAHACGMSDNNYFARMFKKVEGYTPGEFRRMW